MNDKRKVTDVFAELGRCAGADDWDRALKVLYKAWLDDIDVPDREWLSALFWKMKGDAQQTTIEQVDCYRRAWEFMRDGACRNPWSVRMHRPEAPWAVPAYMALLEKEGLSLEVASSAVRSLRKCVPIPEDCVEDLRSLLEFVEVKGWGPIRQDARAILAELDVSPAADSLSCRSAASEVRRCLSPFDRRNGNDYLDDADLLTEVRLPARKMIDRLGHPEKAVRARAACMLGVLRSPDAAPRLWAARADNDRVVRSMAVVSFAEVVRSDPGRVQIPARTLVAMLQMLRQDRSQDGRAHAARAIGIVGHDSSAVRAGLLAALDDDDPKAVKARPEVVEALGVLGCDSDDVRQRLFRMFDEGDRRTRLAVVEALGRLGARGRRHEDVIEKLAEIVRSPQPGEADAAVSALRRWGRQADAAVPGLVERLHHASIFEITAVLGCLLCVADPAGESYEEWVNALIHYSRLGDSSVIAPQANMNNKGGSIIRLLAMRAIRLAPLKSSLKRKLLVERLWMDWSPDIRFFAAEALIQEDSEAARTAEAWRVAEQRSDVIPDLNFLGFQER